MPLVLLAHLMFVGASPVNRLLLSIMMLWAVLTSVTMLEVIQVLALFVLIMTGELPCVMVTMLGLLVYMVVRLQVLIMRA